MSTSALSAEILANEIPLYDGVKKSATQIEADQKFIDTAIKVAGNRKSAVDQMVAAGWDAINKNDTALAIRRFNQGFLLEPKDYRIYWGLGIASSIKNDYERSQALFVKGYTLNQQDERFLSDYGFSIQQQALFLAQTKKIDPRAKFLEAKKIYQKAIELKPGQALPHARLAVILFYQGDCVSCLKEVAIAKTAGGEGLDPRFLKDLKNTCPG
jgi:tetratricopeptide (TPR) repeat protein